MIFLNHKVPTVLVYSVPGGRGGGGSPCILPLGRLYHCMKYLLKTTVIFRLSLFVLPGRRDLPPVNAVLMQIRLQESTYYKQLTFVLIY